MTDHIIKALCNTLMHSLWQGILLAVIAGAIIIFTKRTRAAFRYNLLVGALTLFALGVTATFIWHLQKPVADGASNVFYSTGSPTGAIQTTAAHATNTAPAQATTPAPIAPQSGAQSITETVMSYFNTHYATVVLIWFLIICAKSVQMAVGLHSVSHVKRTKVNKVSEDWENRLLQLAKQLHIQQGIRLMESGIAKVPMVVGHLKPVILIPIGLINSLPANEVEAVLIHELAHIRRRDYLVNLLQNVMEILLFFNPAVLWISQLIKTERENCCDDLTIAQSRNKESYIRAMVSCEEYQAVVGAYAMAFPGAKNTLLHRVARIVRNRNYSLSLPELTILAVCLVVMGLGISAFTASENIKRENTKEVLQPIAPVIHHNATAKHKQPAPVAKSAALLSPFRHQALEPPAKPDTNKRAFDTSRAIARELYHEQLVVDTNHLSINLNDRELIVNGVRMPQEVHERIYWRFGRGGNYGGSLAPPYENKHPGPYDTFLKQRTEEIAADLLRENLVNDKNLFSYRLSRDEFLIDGVRQSDEFRRRIVEKYFKPDDQFNLNYIRRDPAAHAYNNDQKGSDPDIYKKLVADLLQDGLITDPKSVTFELKYNQLTVNGKRQGDEVYRKYKDKYVPDYTGNSWNWTYSHHE